jgi:hypothetical protein
VEEAGDDRHHVEAPLGQEFGHRKGVHQVGLTRLACLPFVLVGGKDVRPAQKLRIGVRLQRPDLQNEIVDPDHVSRCLTPGMGGGGGAIAAGAHDTGMS